MARMAREKWYDIARDLDWELSYVDYEAVFPEWMCGRARFPARPGRSGTSPTR